MTLRDMLKYEHILKALRPQVRINGDEATRAAGVGSFVVGAGQGRIVVHMCDEEGGFLPPILLNAVAARALAHDILHGLRLQGVCNDRVIPGVENTETMH